MKLAARLLYRMKYRVWVSVCMTETIDTLIYNNYLD